MTNKKILSAKEILQRHDIGCEPESQMFQYACDAMREFHQQFCRRPTDEELENHFAKSKSMRNHPQALAGAKYVRDNFTGDAVEFAEWITSKNTVNSSLMRGPIEWTWEVKKHGVTYYSTEQLYQLFLNQKNKEG